MPLYLHNFAQRDVSADVKSVGKPGRIEASFHLAARLCNKCHCRAVSRKYFTAILTFPGKLGWIKVSSSALEIEGDVKIKSKRIVKHKIGDKRLKRYFVLIMSEAYFIRKQFFPPGPVSGYRSR